MNAKNSTANDCPLCQHPTRELTDPQLDINGPVTYKVCTHCEFIYKNVIHHVDLHEEKRQYNLHNNSSDNKGYVNMFKRFIAEAIDPFIKQGKGLDFGSGPGPVLYQILSEEGFEMDHYDPFYHPNEDVFNTTYDLITSTEVFEHLVDPQKELLRLEKCLKKGGILALMTSFHPNNDPEFLSWWYRRDPTHISFYRVKTFESLIKKTQLSIHYTNHKNIMVLKKT